MYLFIYMVVRTWPRRTASAACHLSRSRRRPGPPRGAGGCAGPWACCCWPHTTPECVYVCVCVCMCVWGRQVGIPIVRITAHNQRMPIHATHRCRPRGRPRVYRRSLGKQRPKRGTAPIMCRKHQRRAAAGVQGCVQEARVAPEEPAGVGVRLGPSRASYFLEDTGGDGGCHG